MIDKVAQIGLTFLCRPFCATFICWGFGWKRGGYGELVSKWHEKVRPICAKILGFAVKIFDRKY